MTFPPVKRLRIGEGGGRERNFLEKDSPFPPNISLERHVIHAAGLGRKRRAQIFIVVLTLLRALLGTVAAGLGETAGSAVAAFAAAGHAALFAPALVEELDALCLDFGGVAILPLLIGKIVGNSSLSIGGTSVIIVVGVALETVQALESQMLMRQYKGFLE